MIDWTKPIRHAKTKDAARLVYTCRDNAPTRVVTADCKDGSERVYLVHDTTELFENVPDPPAHDEAGRWFNLYLTDNGIRVYGGTYATDKIALDCLSRAPDDKYIATLQIPPAPPAEPKPKPIPPASAYAGRWVNLWRHKARLVSGSTFFATEREAVENADRHKNYVATVQIPDVPAPPVEPEPKPNPPWATPGLEVEVGKFYRTRDGRKALVTDYNPTAKFPYAVSIDGKHVDTVTPCGTVWHTLRASKVDLVAEWTEPDPVFANVYELENGEFQVGHDRFPSHVEAAAYGLEYAQNKPLYKRLVTTFQVS